MIRREDLAGCRDRAGLAALLAALGWSLELRPLEPGLWRKGGVAAIPEGVELFHAARRGPVELFVAEGAGARDAVGEWTARLLGWNYVLNFITIYRDTNTCVLSMFGADARRNLRRIDLDPAAPRAEALARASALALVPGRSDHDLAAGLQHAFEKESVGRAFFVRFRDDVARLAADLGRTCPGEEPRELYAEALLILSRILFLYFVQEKGWLDGDRAYLPRLVRRSAEGREGIFSGVLLPLFFGCLNTPVRSRDPFAKKLGRIPYLNGGLFEPSAFERRHPAVTIDDAVLEGALFDGFERFQFAVEEDDEAGAHIDPEMLGRVFENLMAEDERAESGSFYTPKEVVDVVAGRALAAWLGREDRRVGGAVTRWLGGERRAIEGVATPAFLERVRSVRVLDPACGSGAFLLACLQLLERLERDVCAALGAGSDSDLRRRIVARALHGIDLKPEAVRLCELRLWLAIASAWKGDAMEIEPLPNLDRNIVQGNALVGALDFAAASRLDLYREWRFALRAREELIGRYRRSRGEERSKLQRALRRSDRDLALALCDREIESSRAELVDRQAKLFSASEPRRRPCIEPIEARIAAAEREREKIERGELGFAEPEVHFAHVTATGGFDLVVGNPPWVRAPRIDPAMRRMLAERYPLFGKPFGGRGIHQGELALAFFEKSVRLAGDGGAVALLVPAKVATADYGARFRAELPKLGRLVELHDWSDRARTLFDADTFPLAVTVVKRAKPGATRVQSDGCRFVLAQRELVATGGGPWVLAPPEVRAVLERLRSAGERFTDRFSPPVMGIKTGSNGDFFVDPEIDREGRTARVEGIEVPLEALAKVIRGRDVRRWRAEGSVWMLWPQRGAAWYDRWRAAAPRRAEGLAWVREAHVAPKVVWKDIGRGMQAAAVMPHARVGGTEVRLVPNQTVYCAAMRSMEEAHLAAAILNSTVAGAWLATVADRAKDAHFRYFGRTVASLPVPRLTRTLEGELVELSKTAAGGGEVEPAVDAVVAKGFGVARGEIELLRWWLDRRLGRG